MDNPGYVSLSRQAGLLKELNTIANNIANADTAGYKREGALFTEYIAAAGRDDPSLSIGRLGAHFADLSQGEFNKTGGTFDVAIQGEGFFLIGTPGGERLSRAGHFMTTAEGTLVNPDGFSVLDDAGGEIQIPPEVAQIAIAGDGTISADGNALGRLGVVTAAPENLVREGSNLWRAEGGYKPVEERTVLQGFIESSNVDPVSEIARLIEVQRNYETGQKIFEQEDERISQVIQTVSRP
ncbi:MAG: flagellar hook-basal body complex protein [Aquisalinus sp.]|nr:flagellar hook-basal body complex protein [Aquisalinus sp.]